MQFRRQRNRSGSVLVYVLALVVIAGLMAASYLAFVDNQSARTGRNLNQDGFRITTEQALLNLESAIRRDLLAHGEIDLARLNLAEAASGISLNLSSKMDGSGGELLQVQPFASAHEYEQLLPLSNQDLFGQAHALVTTIDVDITTSATVPNVRLPDLNVTDHPQIAVREIPVSQFTVFSAGDPFTLGTAVFSDDVGRVFSESTVSVSGSFTSEFAIVTGRNVNFQDGSLQIKNPSDNSASVTLSTDTQSPNFLSDARTVLDSKIVTGGVLPINSAALNIVYSPGNSGQGTSNGLNLSLLKEQCDLLVVARPDKPISTPNGKQYLVAVSGKVAGKNLIYSPATTSAPKSQPTPGPQTVVFAAAQNEQNPSQTILTLDYFQLGGVPLGSVFLVVQDPAGNPMANAVILVRGAQQLNGAFSIVSPHPIIIAGDFNDGDEAASIITPANLQTVAEDWGSDVFGAYK